MKKFRSFLIISLILTLFISCNTFQPELCEVELIEESHCTVTLDKTKVTRGSFVKATVTVDKGYYFDEFAYSLNYYFAEEENTYYIPVLYNGQKIQAQILAMPKRNIYVDERKCTITKSTYSTFEGDTVTFKVKPDYYYYCSQEFISVQNYYDSTQKVSFTKIEGKENEYSFIMPSFPVEIRVNCELGLKSIKSTKKSFVEGEKITFDVENYTPNAVFNIKLYNYYDEEFISNYYTLPKLYEITNSYPAGMYELRIYPTNSNSPYQKAEFQVNFEGIADGWNAVNLISTNDTINKSGYNSLYVLDKDKNSFKLKYYLMNSSTQVKSEENELWKDHSGTSYGFWSTYNFSNEDFQNYNKIVIWAENTSKKLISKPITLDFKKD